MHDWQCSIAERRREDRGAQAAEALVISTSGRRPNLN
jgi:hypothetical protein